ncbi:hypothetical protein NDU88_008920 [Pleurodeles waltl]|uniref:Uncharacterized protein n=1 Tax=Pleurodeles waltl TaxID=8319 RepID=A0AAV7PTK0_PLEWA|nr:hypothetical protein NDU88_008920 [Pleurodeles waltl]
MALESDWRYSRAHESGVSRCTDDRGPGISNMNPDFQVREDRKREDGRLRAAEETDAADFQMAELTVTESETQEEPKKRAGTSTGGTENREPSEETIRSCHFPGGAWLTKDRKREDGRLRAAEESDVADFQTAELTVTESETQEEPKKFAGTTDGPRSTGGTENRQPSEETLRSRHVPGGTASS